jgi:hypothetical protein
MVPGGIVVRARPLAEAIDTCNGSAGAIVVVRCPSGLMLAMARPAES